MAIIKPFRALRPRSDMAGRICELPYDVMSSAEARKIAAGNPWSFLHVSKAEIDLPPETDPHDPQIYRRAAENLSRLMREGALYLEEKPCFYLYRQIMGNHSQTGLVGVASCEEYLKNNVKKHELTRSDKEEDRCKHIEAVNAQTGPAFLVYRETASLAGSLSAAAASDPDVDFVAADGVRHSSWTVRDPVVTQKLEHAFRELPALYIADGHHRSAAAARLWQKTRGAGNTSYFLSVVFSHKQVQILPYNRVLKDLNGLSAEQFMNRLSALFKVGGSGVAVPQAPHEVALYLGHMWTTLSFRESLLSSADPVANLDASLLQKHVLAPLLGINDPRTSQRISFVGGIRGTIELEKLVDSGEFACAFSLHPTTVDDLMAVADAGGIMPPKSTWFEPKLRDGMFSHPLGL